MLALLTRRRTVTQPASDAPVNDPQPARPDDLAIRFSTVGGSYVDVAGRMGHREDHYRWTCHGCQDRSNFPQRGSLNEMREGANNHANQCRAIPL